MSSKPNINLIDIKKDNFGISFDKTNDNFVAILNYLSELGTKATSEQFLANEGQTEFTLTLGEYIPGTNTLKVCVDGIEQAPMYSYTETTPTSFTFTEPLESGQVVDVTYTVITSIIDRFHTRERVTLDGGNFNDSIDTDTIIVDGGDFSSTPDLVYDGESFTRGVY